MTFQFYYIGKTNEEYIGTSDIFRACNFLESVEIPDDEIIERNLIDFSMKINLLHGLPYSYSTKYSHNHLNKTNKEEENEINVLYKTLIEDEINKIIWECGETLDIRRMLRDSIPGSYDSVFTKVLIDYGQTSIEHFMQVSFWVASDLGIRENYPVINMMNYSFSIV